MGTENSFILMVYRHEKIDQAVIPFVACCMSKTIHVPFQQLMSGDIGPLCPAILECNSSVAKNSTIDIITADCCCLGEVSPKVECVPSSPPAVTVKG